MQETWVRFLGQEDSLEKETATHSSTLALKIPWTEERGAGYCPWGRKESGTTEQQRFIFTYYFSLVIINILRFFKNIDSQTQSQMD